MKRILAVFLVCVMVFALLPTVSVPVLAAADSGAFGELAWSFTDDGVLTISGEGAMPDYTDATFKQVPWYSHAKNVTKIVIDKGITYVGAYTFYNTSDVFYPNVTSIEIRGAQEIGTYAFFHLSAVTELILGEGVTTLDSKAFANCTGLTTVAFPRTLTTFGSQAFFDCDGLQTVTVPEGASLGALTFGSCDALTSVNVPGSVVSIESTAFSNCPLLTIYGENDSVADMHCILYNVPFVATGTAAEVLPYSSGTDGETTWTFYCDGTLRISGEGAMTDYTDDNYNTVPWKQFRKYILRVEIGEDITHVGDYTFYNPSGIVYPNLTTAEIFGDATIGVGAFRHSDLVEIVMDGDIALIGSNAFTDCEDLTTVVFNGELQQIASYAFRSCTSLETLELPDGTQIISDCAFWDCANLENIFIPDSVSSIGGFSFYNCPCTVNADTNSWAYMYAMLKGMDFVSTGLQDPAAVYDSGTTGDVSWTFYADGTLVIEGEGAMADYTGKDAPWYPYRSQILSVQIGEGVTEVGALAFNACSRITEVYFEGDAPEIASDAFKTVTANAYYHYVMEGWTEDVLLNYGGKLTWESMECIHTYETAVTEPTCLESGYTTYTCSKCGDTYTADETEPLGHDYVGTVTEPTCLDAGFTTYVCSRCEDTYTGDETDALGHDYVGTVTEPTCLDAGYTTYVCSRCEDTYEGDETEPLGHEEVIDEAVAPTCTETGLTEGSHCAVCGETIVPQETVPMADHDYIADVTAPTCTKDGSVTYTCSCCGETYTEVLSAVECPTKDYKDVPNTSNWGHAGIDFCVERGIMGSMSKNELIFEPGTTCTRAMIVSILYRLSGSPEVEYEDVFPDVPDGQWYSDAVIWGYQHGVVKGFDTGKFEPNGKITREQMAVILKGYTENVVGKDTSACVSLDQFYDANKVTWSKPCVEWAVAVGMIYGKTQSDGKTMLDPKGNATRAEVASILMRYIQNFLER